MTKVCDAWIYGMNASTLFYFLRDWRSRVDVYELRTEMQYSGWLQLWFTEAHTQPLCTKGSRKVKAEDTSEHKQWLYVFCDGGNHCGVEGRVVVVRDMKYTCMELAHAIWMGGNVDGRWETSKVVRCELVWSDVGIVKKNVVCDKEGRRK